MFVGLFFFLLPGRPEGHRIPRAANRVRGVMQPHKFSCGSALAAASATHKGPQEATPGTRPPATPTLGRRPQLNGQPTAARTLVPARSVKSTPLSNPEGPRRGCAAGQHTQHFGLFVPRCRSSPTNLTDAPMDTPGICTGPRSKLWLPTARSAPGNPVGSGPS